MAYGNETGGWCDIWNNGYYSTGVFYVYKVDEENRKFYIRLNTLRCCSLNGYYSFYNLNGCECGYRLGSDSVGWEVASRVEAFNVSGGACDVKADQWIEKEVSYNDDGSLPSICYSMKFYNGVSAPNGPSFGWTTADITSTLPKIGKKTTEIKPKRYNGSSWINSTPYRYNGSKWVKITDIKRYNGSKWVSLKKS